MRKRLVALCFAVCAIFGGVGIATVQPAGAANVVMTQQGWFPGQNATFHVVVDWFDNGTGHMVAQKYALHTGTHLGQAMDAWMFDFTKVVIAPGTWGSVPLHINICDDDNGAGSPNYYSPYPWGGIGDTDINGISSSGNWITMKPDSYNWFNHGSYWATMGSYVINNDIYTNCATMVGV